MLLEHVQDSDLEGTLEVLRQAASIPDIYDTKDSNYSILHHCCYRGCLPIAKILVEGGANLCAVDKFHKTAIHLAVQNGYCELAEYLLQHVHPMERKGVGEATNLCTIDRCYLSTCRILILREHLRF